jgi:hypothetical protein
VRRAALAIIGATIVVGLALVPLASPSKAASGPPGAIAATAEAYAYRIEYDIPLPVGTGTVGHVNATVSRAPSGESAHGIAGAPTELDPVVAGKYVDPAGTGHPQRVPPQAECYYPGALLSTRFVFPTDTQRETSGLPPTSYAVADCGAGPTSQLHAHNGPISDPASATQGPTADAASSDALARPNHDVLEAEATSRASGVSLAAGALHIRSVVASGASATTGSKGGGRSRAAVTINDVSAGGVTFSLSSTNSGDGDGNKVELTSGGQTSGADSASAKAVVAAANQALKPVGCELAVLSDPNRYPQGFVFARPEPDVGVRKDGTLAASYRGGLLVVCEVPDNPVAQSTKFSPERIQVVLGFVYTSAAANPAAGGFGLGDLASDPSRPLALGSPGVGLAPAPGEPAAITVPPGSPAPSGTAAAGPSSGTSPSARAARAKPKSIAAVGPLGMGTGMRVLLGLVCVAAWAGLTHVGASRFRRATAPCPPGGER